MIKNKKTTMLQTGGIEFGFSELRFIWLRFVWDFDIRISDLVLLVDFAMDRLCAIYLLESI